MPNKSGQDAFCAQIYSVGPGQFKKWPEMGEYLRGVDELLIKFQNMTANGDSFETFGRRVSICIWRFEMNIFIGQMSK